MVDRRRSPRLDYSQRQRARIRTVHEAAIEKLADDSAEVSTMQPAARGERLVLQCTTAAGDVTFRVAEVISCAPSPGQGGMRWRITLSLVSPGVEPRPAR
jgi:hypothetical protein